MRALIAALIAAAACTPDFQAASEVRDLRILGVQAEPPEAQYDPSASPPTVDPVVVTVLAVDPRDGGIPMTMTYQLCAPTDSRRCDTGFATEPIPQALRPTTLQLDPATVKNALSADDLKGLGGIRVQFSFFIENGSGPVFGSKVLLFSPPGGKPNHNPAIANLSLTRDGGTYDPATVNPGDTLELPLDAEIGLRPNLTADSREEYVVTDYRGNRVDQTEQPRYSFFVSPGAEIGVDSADEPLDGGAPPDGLSWIAARSLPAAGDLWIVVRDGRGGESWVRFPWKTREATRAASRPADPVRQGLR
jgi:hypothetical protein